MFRRFVARQVSQACEHNVTGHVSSEYLDVAVRSHLFLLRALCVAPNLRWRGGLPQLTRSATSSLSEILRVSAVPSNIRSFAVLSDLACVSGLEALNDELAEAVVIDRATARVRLYNDVMWSVHSTVSDDRARMTRPVERPIHASDLLHLTERQLVAKMRPCVSQSELLQGTEDALRLRLAALLHFTGLQDQVPVDLRSSESMQQLKDKFAVAAQNGTALGYKRVEGSQKPVNDSWKAPVSLAEAHRRMKANLTQGPSEDQVPIDALAQLLVDAGLEDVVSLDMTVIEAQRDCDALLLATGRSPQHAFAGAKAVRYVLKQARRGTQMARQVVIAHDASTPWYSVNSGGISVHCMSRDVRAELDLETLWGNGTNATWWQRGPASMTLDTIQVEASTG